MLQKQAFCGFVMCHLGDRKSLSIAKNHPKTSQEFSEQFGPSTHEKKGFCKNSHQKVHPHFTKNLGRRMLGNTFSGPNHLKHCWPPQNTVKQAVFAARPWKNPKKFREVPNGVGADGVGVKFPIFPVNCSRLPLFQENRKKTKKNEEKRRKTKKKRRKTKKKSKKRRKTKKNEKNGKTPPTPSTPTPLRTS